MLWKRASVRLCLLSEEDVLGEGSRICGMSGSVMCEPRFGAHADCCPLNCKSPWRCMLGSAGAALLKSTG